MMSRLRLASISMVAVFVVAGCGNSNNGGKKDLSVNGGEDLSADVDFAINPDVDMAVSTKADLAQVTNGDGGAACTVITVWPGQSPFAAFDDTGPVAFTIGFQGTTLPTLGLQIEDWASAGATMTPNTETYTSATHYKGSGSCNLCSLLFTCVDNGGTPDCSGDPAYLAVAGTATSAADADPNTGRMISTGTNLKFVEWDFTADAPVANGSCYIVNTLNYDKTWDFTPADGGTTGPSTGLYYYDDFATATTYQLGREVGAAAATDLALSPRSIKGWDVNAAGTKIAYSASATATPTRFDLVVASADGTGAATRVSLANAGRGVSRISFSPDGTKIAYFSDDANVAGANDVWVVDTAGATAAVNLNTTAILAAIHAGDTRVNNVANTANYFAWSLDSHYLAFTGDFSTDRKTRLFIADFTGASPVVKSAIADSDLTLTGTAAAGATQRLDWTDTNKVIYKARLAVANSYSLFVVPASGVGAAALANQPASPALVGALSTSPDGKTLAFSANTSAASTVYKIYTMKSDGSAAPVDLFAAAATPFVPAANTGTNNFFAPLNWSPDGTKIAFVADYGTNNQSEAYVVAAAGGNPLRVAHNATVTKEVRQLAWSPDSKQLALTGNYTNATYDVYTIANVTTADQTPTLVKSVTGTGTNFDWTDDSIQPSIKWVALP